MSQLGEAIGTRRIGSPLRLVKSGDDLLVNQRHRTQRMERRSQRTARNGAELRVKVSGKGGPADFISNQI
jgi:hypothetical protein